jgi:site-specific recombinase XerD
MRVEGKRKSKQLQRVEDYMLTEGRTQGTIASYLYHIEHFINTNANCNKFTYPALITAIDKEKHRGSFAVFVASVKLYYQYLFDNRYRNDNPASLIKLGKKKQHHVQFQDLLTRSELEELFNGRENRYAGTKERNQVIISLLIYQGLTSQEIVTLKLNNVDLDACTVRVKKTATTNPRVLALNPKQIKPMMDYLNHREQNNRWNYKELLIGVRHKPYTVDAIIGMLNQFQNLVPGKTINATTIRQSVIANWLNTDKKPLADVQLLSGHRYPSSTLRYRREDPEEKRKLINQFHPMLN